VHQADGVANEQSRAEALAPQSPKCSSSRRNHDRGRCQRLTGAASAATPTLNVSDRNAGGFWPNGARLAVSLSLMFEGGGQPISGAGGVIPDAIEKGVPDLPTNAFFAYGHYEASPRARTHGQARHQAQFVHDR